MTTDAYDLAPLVYHFAGHDTIPVEWEPRFSEAGTAWGRHGAGLMRGDGYVLRRGERGPAGVGCMAAPGRMEAYAPEALRYAPDAQDWAEFAPGVWCGVARAAGPADFLRAKLCQPFAYVLKTARGDWLIPVGLLTATNCNLPRVDQFRCGQWCRVAAPELAQIAADAERLYRAEIGEEPAPDGATLRDIAIRAIGANYALTGPEMGLLALLHDDTYAAVSAILTDRAERQKKTAASAG